MLTQEAREHQAVIRHGIAIIPAAQHASLDVEVIAKTAKVRITRPQYAPLVRYLKAKRITIEQKTAGDRWGEAYSRYIGSGAQDLDQKSGGSYRGFSNYQLEALQEYQKAREAIKGQLPELIAHKVCCEGESIAIGGKANARNFNYLLSALVDLSKHYGYA